MFGLVLAIGIVVDDAIVVVEAVQRHIDDGMSPREATVRAMEEVSAPVVAIAFILAAVFIPVAFLGGISGQIYKQFALTIAVSVLLSAFSALSLSPALSALLLRPHKQTRGVAGAPLRLVQPRLRLDHQPLSRRRRRADPTLGAGARRRCVVLLDRGRRSVQDICPPASCPTKTRARSSSPCACPMALPPNAPTRPPQRSRTVVGKLPGVDKYFVLGGTRYRHRHLQFQRRHHHRTPEALGRAHRRKDTQLDAILARAQRGVRDRFPKRSPSPSDCRRFSGSSTTGGFQFMLEDRAGGDIADSGADRRRADRRRPASARNWRT